MTKTTFLLGDITTQKIDAIVNPANRGLIGGGGLDGVINEKAGPKLVEASRKLSPCPTGEARMTPGFNLPAKFVIHTVGPIYEVQKDDAPELLAKCYRSCLDLAKQQGLTTIAFPSISTGVFGYPIILAAPIAVDTVQAWIAEHPDKIQEVRFILHSQQDFELYESLIPVTK